MKNKFIAMLLCGVMTASIIPSSEAKSAPALLKNESYNQYATNEIPSALNASSNAHFIKEYKEGDKALWISSERKTSTYTESFTASEKLTISFDVMSSSPNLTGSVKLGQSGGTSFEILSFAKMNEIKNHNGYHVAGYSDTSVTGMAIAVDVKRNCYDIYVNGRLIYNDVRIAGKTLTAVNSVIFSTIVNDETGSGIFIDNLNVNEGLVPLKSYPVADFNTSVEPEVVIQTEAKSGSAKIMEETFEDVISHTVMSRQNTISQVKEENGNTALLFERFNSNDFHLDCGGINSSQDYAVYEFDINLINPLTAMSIQLKDINSHYSTVARVEKGNLVLGSFNYPMDANTWYRVAAVYNYFDRTKTYYVNGEIVTTSSIETVINTGSEISVFRFYHGSGSAEEKPVKIMIDNVRVYENPVPLEDLSQMKREIVIDKSASIFVSDDIYHQKLEGYTALHARSGMLYNNKVKTRLKNETYQSGNSWMLPAGEVSELLSIPFEENESSIKVSGKMLSNGEFEVKNGVKYVNADTYFGTLLGKKVFHDEQSKNTGLIIAGSKMFEPGNDTSAMQNLNNYVFYQRPAPDEIKSAYEASPLKGQHPRIQATKADFERIKQNIASDSYMAFWAEFVMNSANGLVEDPTPLIYELRDGVRLLYVSRDALKNMYSLGMAYQLTGDKKYADRAWIDLQSICTFPDWHPSHDIDLGEMSAAVALGYDWMYDAFTPEQREVIEYGFYLNGLFDACQSYQSGSGRLGRGGITTNNHNVVINGGITMGAMAFMDVYPEECSYAVSGAIKATDIMLHQFAPSGAWFEGPHYWEYTTQYTSKMLSTLDSVLGDCFTLDKTQGISTASNYILNMQSDQGIFNYGDGTQASIYVPEMFWISNKYNDILSTAVTMTFSEGQFTDVEDYTLALLFYDSAKNADSDSLNLSTDAYYEGEEVVVFRDKWTNGDTSFAGIHAGKTKVTHSHLDGGSFIFDYAGFRWATDLGMAPYDLPEAADYSEYGTRWKMYMARAESHNTIVINPDEKPDHKVSSFAALTRFESKAKGGIAVVDMTQLLSENADAAKRGMFYTDDRNSLVVRDEITLKKYSDVYWFMQTKADVEITPTGAILTRNGRVMNLEFTSSVPAQISVGESVPLATSPVVENDKMPGAKRIMIKLSGSGNVDITVKLTPGDLPVATPISDYNIPIDTWQIPDGEIQKLPYLDSISIDGRNIELTDNRIVDFVCVEGDYTQVPDISAYSSKYNVTMEKGATLAESTKIYVSDGTVTSIYNVNFNIVPQPVQFDGSTSFALTNAKASDEPEPHNPAFHAIDCDLNSRWAVSGIDQWIELELKDAKVIDKVALAFISGDKRKAKFDISVSTDGINYTPVYDGWSSGTTTSYEFFEFAPIEAKYIRLGCDGNSAQGLGGWTSLAEIVVMKNN